VEGFTTDFRDELRTITIPTLIVHGDLDAQAPLELCGRRTAQLVPGHRFRVYEKAAHGLFLTHAARINAELRDFARSKAA
jgi:pimeloyl-ACP methyl ester carboxylesterase